MIERTNLRNQPFMYHTVTEDFFVSIQRNVTYYDIISEFTDKILFIFPNAEKIQ